MATVNKLQELVETLSPEQRAQLRDLGITKQRLSDYKAGRRPAPLRDIRLIATVAGADFTPIVEEMAELDATPEQLSFFRRAMERSSAVMTVAAVAVLMGLVSASSPAEAHKHALSPSKAGPTLYIM